MNYVIERSSEGFEILKPHVAVVDDFLNTIIVNDNESWKIPYAHVGVNLFNPLGKPAAWVYDHEFSAVPAGIKNSGFALAGIEGDCAGFSATPDELVRLLLSRYGDTMYNAAELQVIKQYASAIDALYAERDAAVVSEVDFWEALAKSSEFEMCFLGRQLFMRIVSVLSDSASLKAATTTQAFLQAVTGNAPSTNNLRLSVEDACDCLKVCCLCIRDKALYDSEAKLLTTVFNQFVLAAERFDYLGKSAIVVADCSKLLFG